MLPLPTSPQRPAPRRRALAGLRLLLVILVTGAMAPVALISHAVTRGRARGVCSWALRTWSRLLLPAIGVRVVAEGPPPPRGPCVVCPNHMSHLDIAVLGALYGGVFVSRADVADWPIVGLLVRSVGTLFIRRELRADARRVGAEVEAEIRRGGRVTIFLEGGAGRGDVVRPFRSALLEAPATTGTPCVPALVRYTLPGDPDVDPADAVAWADGQPFAAHTWGILELRRIVAHVTFLPPRTDTDRKRLARALEDDVREAAGTAGWRLETGGWR